jgi:hypothetical protein
LKKNMVSTSGKSESFALPLGVMSSMPKPMLEGNGSVSLQHATFY